jgi:hypothetical protein
MTTKKMATKKKSRTYTDSATRERKERKSHVCRRCGKSLRLEPAPGCTDIDRKRPYGVFTTKVLDKKYRIEVFSLLCPLCLDKLEVWMNFHESFAKEKRNG